MSRVWLVALIAVTVAAPAAALADRAVVGAVVGSVVDDVTGQPLAGALVNVGGGEATTDDQGRFRVDGPPPNHRPSPVALSHGGRFTRIRMLLKINGKPNAANNTDGPQVENESDGERDQHDAEHQLPDVRRDGAQERFAKHQASS